MEIPETKYVQAADAVYIAYQVVGSGPVDVVYGFNPDEGNVDLMWDEPDWRPFLAGTAEFARVILHDRRGTGVSSRNVPPPNLETRVSDLLTVLDAVGSDRPILAAGSEPGAMHALFAATHPERLASLLWNNPVARTAWAPDYPWGLGPEEFERSLQEAASWGTLEYGRSLEEWRAAERAGVQPSDLRGMTHDEERLHMYARINRNTASPDVAREINRIYWETDIRAILPAIHSPTALICGQEDTVEEVRYIESLMPNSTVHVLEGRSGVAASPILAILRGLAGIEPPVPDLETVLSTVLFTDIVDSTSKQAGLGDRRWRDLVMEHHAIVRRALGRWQGVERDTAGDGFYATFEGPARAIRCALEIAGNVQELGIQIRAGIHIGECEIIDGKVGGISVTIGARVAAIASPAEVLVSRTVKDLVAGSGLSFEDRGEHELKGVPDRWRLFRAVPA